MTHAEQLRARLAEAERRIALEAARLANFRAPGAVGLEQAAEGLRRLTDIRDAYARILDGPCPLFEPPRGLVRPTH